MLLADIIPGAPDCSRWQEVPAQASGWAFLQELTLNSCTGQAARPAGRLTYAGTACSLEQFGNLTDTQWGKEQVFKAFYYAYANY